MGQVMVIRIKTNFNVKCLGILSVFANKIETNDRVAKQTNFLNEVPLQSNDELTMNEEVL